MNDKKKSPIKRKSDSKSEGTKSKRTKMGSFLSFICGDEEPGEREPVHRRQNISNNIPTASGQTDTKKLSKSTATKTKCVIGDNASTVSNILWDEKDVLSETSGVPHQIAANFIQLIKEKQTLPFIARYRKAMVDNYSPDKLRELFENYQVVLKLKEKAKSIIVSLKKNNKLTPSIENRILNARSFSELDLHYAPLKTQSMTLAERARRLNLEQPAINLLNNNPVNLAYYCDPTVSEISTPVKVEQHIIYIIADIIYKDPRVVDEIKKIKEITKFSIQTSRSNKSLKKTELKSDYVKSDSKSEPDNFKIYYDFKKSIRTIEGYQILAINRGEENGILTVKIEIPDDFLTKLERSCLHIWSGKMYVNKALSDAYLRLIKPWLIRQIRSELTSKAHKESVKQFSLNLEKCLLREPLKNMCIAGIDPGFKNGCKIGIINSKGSKLDVATIYPDFGNRKIIDEAARKLRSLLDKHNVDVIALGNGTASRETEKWIHEKKITNKPIIIIPENGASDYSISPEASEEHPNMDPNLISALSMARRALDPLAELIKVHPKHLGIGMYQHDIPAKQLEEGLEFTIEKIVSLIGADLNTASVTLLRRVAGLNNTRAKNIVKYREKHGCFKTRTQLMKVTGIGEVTYKQCAGFLKVYNGDEPLDSTIIHPESYEIARKLTIKLGLNITDINKPNFSRSIQRKYIDKRILSSELKTDEETIDLIIKGLTQKLPEEDILKFSKPIYSTFIENNQQLTVGMIIQGVVSNVTTFGCFIDIGIKTNGLIHKSKYGSSGEPCNGDRVSVKILDMPDPKKIQLQLVKIL